MSKRRIAFMSLISCFILAAFSIVGIFVWNHFNSGSPRSYDERLVKEMVRMVGSEEKAYEMLDTLYNAGFVDEKGFAKLGDTFLVNDIKMTKDELATECAKHGIDEKLNVDGVETTWGEISRVVSLADSLSAINDCINSDSKLTDSHITNIKSLCSFLSGNSLEFSGTEEILISRISSSYSDLEVLTFGYRVLLISNDKYDGKAMQEALVKIEGLNVFALKEGTENQYLFTLDFVKDMYDGLSKHGVDFKPDLSQVTAADYAGVLARLNDFLMNGRYDNNFVDQSTEKKELIQSDIAHIAEALDVWYEMGTSLLKDSAKPVRNKLFLNANNTISPTIRNYPRMLRSFPSISLDNAEQDFDKNHVKTVKVNDVEVRYASLIFFEDKPGFSVYDASATIETWAKGGDEKIEAGALHKGTVEYDRSVRVDIYAGGMNGDNLVHTEVLTFPANTAPDWVYAQAVTYEKFKTFSGAKWRVEFSNPVSAVFNDGTTLKAHTGDISAGSGILQSESSVSWGNKTNAETWDESYFNHASYSGTERFKGKEGFMTQYQGVGKTINGDNKYNYYFRTTQKDFVPGTYKLTFDIGWSTPGMSSIMDGGNWVPCQASGRNMAGYAKYENVETGITFNGNALTYTGGKYVTTVTIKEPDELSKMQLKIAAKFSIKFDAGDKRHNGSDKGSWGPHAIAVSSEGDKPLGWVSINMKAEGQAGNNGVKNMVIPKGDYYPGQQVPIRVNFNGQVAFGDTSKAGPIQLDVNGDILSPSVTWNGNDEKKFSDFAMYYYTVKDLDTGTIKILDILVGGVSAVNNDGVSAGQSNVFMADYITKFTIPSSGQYGITTLIGAYGQNNECRLITPRKWDTFTNRTYSTEGVLSKTLMLKMEKVEDNMAHAKIKIWMDMYFGPENDDFSYIYWLANNIQATSDVKYLPDGTKVDKAAKPLDAEGFYLRSMYVSRDGGKTKMPLYVAYTNEQVTITDPVTGKDKTFTEKPYAVYFYEDVDNFNSVAKIAEYGIYYTESQTDQIDYVKNSTVLSLYTPTRKFFIINGVDEKLLFNKEKKDVIMTYSSALTGKNYENGEPLYVEDLIGNNVYLSYNFSDRVKFPLVGDKNFAWISNNTDILRVVSDPLSESFEYDTGVGSGTKKYYKNRGVLNFTGKVGEVTVSLVVLNGGATDYQYEIQSFTFNVKAGLNPFIMVPGSLDAITGLQSEALDILFASNLTERNYEESGALATDFSLEVFEYSGGADGNKGTSVYKTVVTSYNFPNADKGESLISSITIPENVLLNSGDNAYVSYISARSISKDRVIEQRVPIKVKAAAAKVTIGKLKSNYVLDSQNVEITYNVKNLVFEGKGIYTVIRQSDNKVMASGEFTRGENGLTAGKIVLNSADIKVATGLKDIYVIQLSATNDAVVDGYSTDSLVLYVYSTGALQITYDLVKNCHGATFEDGKITFNNMDYLNTLLTNDGKGNMVVDINGGKITLEELRDTLNLSMYVHIDYDNYIWGLLSDQIKWASTDSKIGSLNFYQGGYYSNIESYYYDSYMPISDFLLIGLKDGQTTISATHSRVEGMTDSVVVDVTTLTNKFFLFQAKPKTTTEVKYTNGDGVKKTVTTDPTGLLALFEESGMIGEVYFKSQFEGDTYISSILAKNITTGEQDVSMLLTYPLNVVQLKNASKVTLYFTNQDGTPFADKDVHIRGGVYKNIDAHLSEGIYGGYCMDADLLFNGATNDPVYGLESNGRYTQTVRTDSLGRVVVRYDVSQFYLNRDNQQIEELSPTDFVEYAFEVNFGGDNNTAKYFPTIVNAHSTVTGSLTAKDLSVTVYVQEIGNKSRNAFIGRQYVVNEFGKIDMLGVVTDKVGTNYEHPSQQLITDVMYWDDTNTLTQIKTGDLAGYWVVDESIDVTKYRAELRGVGSKHVPTGQESKYTCYPFSSIPFIRNTFVMDDNSFGTGKKDADGKFIGWIDTSQGERVDIMTYYDGVQVSQTRFDFMVFNAAHVPTVDPNQGGEGSILGSSDDLKDDINDKLDIGSMFNNLVPGGDILASAMAMFAGIQSGGKVGLNMMIVPTQDPTKFNIIVTIGDLESAFSQFELKDSNYFNELYEQMQQEQEKNDNEDNQEADGSGDIKVKFKYSGTIKAQAVYNTKTNSWSIRLTGGEFGASVKVSYEYSQQFVVAGYPCFIDVEAYVQIGANIGVNEYYDMLTEMGLAAGVEAFGGIGGELGIIEIKFGVFGKVEAGASFAFIVSNNCDATTGTKLAINGEIGIKFEVKLLMFSFEQVLGSVKFGWERQSDGYKAIMDYWEGTTREGLKYSATHFSDGQILYAIESSGVEDRDYLKTHVRYWLSSEVLEDVSIVQNNSYPNSNPVLTEDGSMMIYLSDENNGETSTTVAYYSNKNAQGGYDEGKAIAKSENDSVETYGYGDSTLTAAGTSNFAVAAWAAQTDTVKKEQGQEITAADQLLIMNSAEISVAMFKNGAWAYERLTNNGTPDMLPQVAVNGDYAVVAWRSVMASSAGSVNNYNVENRINYKVYRNGAWTTSTGVAYSGNSGAVVSFDVAITDSGDVLITYETNTLEGEELKKGESGNEVFVTTIYTASGETKTYSLRMTSDLKLDMNPQVLAIKEEGKSKFILTWYNGTDKVMRTAKLSPDGTLDVSYGESYGLGSSRIKGDYKLIGITNGSALDIVFTWKEKTSTVDTSYDTLYAAKVYKSGENIYKVTSPQTIGTMGTNTLIDSYSAYLSGGTVKAAMLASDYTVLYDKRGFTTNVEIAGTVEQFMLVKPFREDKDEKGLTYAGDMILALDDDSKPYQKDGAWVYRKATANDYIPMVKDGEPVLNENGTAKLMTEQVAITKIIPNSTIRLASRTFKDSVTAEFGKVWTDRIDANDEVELQLTITNTGISDLQSITLTDRAMNELHRETVTIAPAESKTIVVYHRLGTVVEDLEWTLTAVSGSGNVTTSGTLLLNRPDTGVSSVIITESKDATRTVNVTLINSTNIPLAGNNKVVKVGLFANSGCTVPITKESGEKYEKTIKAEYLPLVDAGRYVYVETLSVESLLTLQYTAEELAEANGEIPENGLTVFAKVWIESEDGKLFEEEMTSNNKSSVTMYGKLESAGELVSISNEVAVKEDGADVTIYYNNNSINEQTLGGLRVQLLNIDNVVIGTTSTFKNGISSVVLTPEQETSHVLTVTQLYTGYTFKDVKGARVSYAPTTVKYRFDYVKSGYTGTDQTTTEFVEVPYGSTIVSPAVPTPPVGFVFRGWIWKDSTGVENAWDFANDIVEDEEFTLYAKWILTPANITSQPQSVSVLYDGKVKNIKVSAIHGLTIEYQWYELNLEKKQEVEAAGEIYDGSADRKLEGETLPETSFTKSAESGTYYCKLSVTSELEVKSIDTAYVLVNIIKRNVTLTGATEQKVYDGTPLSPNAIMTGNGIAAGQTLSYDKNDRTIIGQSESVIGNAAVKDTGVDVSENYIFTYRTGYLTVTKRDVAFTNSALTSKVYDGMPLSVNYVGSLNEELAERFTVQIPELNSITNVGNVENFNVDIRLFLNNEDVTSNFNMSVQNVRLTITAKEISISADSDSKTYDGIELKKESYEQTGLISGQTLTVTFDSLSKLTFVGTVQNRITVITILDAAGADVTSNYAVTVTSGYLTVTARNIVIESESLSKVYDGEELSSNVILYNENDLANGDIIVYTSPMSLTNIGCIQNSINSQVARIMRGEMDVTDNYNITFISGTLSVEKRIVNVTVNSHTIAEGDADKKLSYNLDNSFIGEDEKNLTVTREEGTKSGVYRIMAKFEDNLNYTVNILYPNADNCAYYTILQKKLSLNEDKSNVKDGEVTVESEKGEAIGNRFVVSAKDAVDFKGVKYDGFASFRVSLKQVYDITMESGNVIIQPNGKLQIRIKIDDGIKSNKYEKLALVYIDENNQAKVVDASIVDGYYVFSTDHLSVYGIIDTSIPAWFILTIVFGGVVILLVLAVFIIRAKAPSIYFGAKGGIAKGLSKINMFKKDQAAYDAYSKKLSEESKK